MDLLSVLPTTWRGVDAWRVEARALVLVVTRHGGHLAALWDRRTGRDPLWQPPWPAADPAAVQSGGAYGDGPEAALLATIVGHNWCCDRFGPAWPGEQRPLHGESGVVAWTFMPGPAQRAIWQAWLPEARLHLRKTVRIAGNTVHLEHAVAHDDDAARAIEWCEHVNVGGDFLAEATFTAGVDRVVNWPHAAEPGSRFAALAPEAEVPIAAALAMPAVSAPPCGDVVTARVRTGWWTARNCRLRRRLHYAWDAQQYPWLCLWTQHHSRTTPPWNGQARVRGMEISTKPWPEGQPPASRAERYLGRPTTCLVPPGRWRTHTLRITWD